MFTPNVWDHKSLYSGLSFNFGNRTAEHACWAVAHGHRLAVFDVYVTVCIFYGAPDSCQYVFVRVATGQCQACVRL